VILACCLDRPSSDPYYVGLKKVDGEDSWLDGIDSDYRPYKDGEPDENSYECFVVKGDTGELEDYDCDETEKYVCKRAPLPACNAQLQRPVATRVTLPAVCLSVCLSVC